MINLLGITLVMSFLDSLNPIAITQQFILQNVVKKKKNICGFIIGMGVTNFLAGVFVYYGLAVLFNRVVSKVLDRYPFVFPTALITIGVLILVYILLKTFIKTQKKESEPHLRNKNINITFTGLTLLGIAYCGFELTSALPYFGFLSILLSQQLNPIVLLTILLVYNLIYSLPLIMMYICYNKFENKLNHFYTKFNNCMAFIIDKVIPVVLVVLGVYLVYRGVNYF